MSRKVHWITDPEQLRVLVNPARHHILDRLTAIGPSSVRSIAVSLGLQPTAIYRHLRMLERVGLVVAKNKSGTRGRPANVYQAIAPLVRFAKAPRDTRNRPIMASIAKSAVLRAAREYGNAFQGTEWCIEGPQRNHWFAALAVAPSRERLALINKLLDQLADLLWTPDPTPGPLLNVSWIISPAAPLSRRRAAASKGAKKRRGSRRGGARKTKSQK